MAQEELLRDAVGSLVDVAEWTPRLLRNVLAQLVEFVVGVMGSENIDDGKLFLVHFLSSFHIPLSLLILPHFSLTLPNTPPKKKTRNKTDGPRTPPHSRGE